MQVKTSVWIAIICILAFTLGLTLQSSRSVIGYDDSHYVNIARNIVAGNGYSTDFISFAMLDKEIPHKDTFRPPLYPFTLAIFFMLFGDTFFVAKLVSILFLGLLAVPVYLLGTELFNRKIGIAAAALAAFQANMLYFSTQAVTELQYAFFLTFSFYLLLLAFKRKGPFHILCGLGLGICYLIKPQTILMLPLVFIAAYLAYGRHINWRRVAVLLLISLVVVSPWLLRNYTVTGNPLHSDTALSMKYAGTDLDVTPFSIHIDQVPTAAQLFSNNPLLFIAGVVKRVFALFYSLGPTLTPLVFLLLFFALIWHLQNWKEHYIVFYMLLLYLFFFGIFYVDYRYFIPLVPIFCVYAASAAQVIVNRIAQRISRQSLFNLFIIFLVLSSAFFGAYKTISYSADEHTEFVEAGEWIGLSYPDVVIMSVTPTSAYYAKSAWVVMPVDDYDSVMRYAAKHGVNIVLYDCYAHRYRPNMVVLSDLETAPEELKLVNSFDGKGKLLIYEVISPAGP